MEYVSAATIRQTAAAVLEKRGYSVISIAKGVGSPPFSMVQATQGDETLICAVKAVTRPQGRIHFGRSERGGWISLSKATHVLHAWCHPDTPDRVTVALFPADVIKDAFDRNFAMRKSAEIQALPIWLSPRLEAGDRFAGSGYGDAAIWREMVPVGPAPSSPATEEPVAKGGSSVMETVKAMLATHLGVSVERIEIDVRVKL